MGARKSTNRHWAKSCHEFRYYETLVESLEAAQGQPAPPGLSGQAAPAQTQDLLRRALRLLAETQGDAWVGQSALLQMIRRLDSSFDPKEHGHANFLAMLQAFDALLEVRHEEADLMVRLR
jgi:hypothetical protein